MAGNKRALNITTNLNDQWHKIRLAFTTFQGRTKRSVSEHEDFAKAILSGDGEAAEDLVRKHLNQVREELVKVLVYYELLLAPPAGLEPTTLCLEGTCSVH